MKTATAKMKLMLDVDCPECDREIDLTSKDVNYIYMIHMDCDIYEKIKCPSCHRDFLIKDVENV